MRLFWNDFVRIWGNLRIYIVLLIACFAQFIGLNSASRNLTNIYFEEDYKKAYEALVDMSDEEIVEKYLDYEFDYDEFSILAYLNRDISHEIMSVYDYEGYLRKVQEEARKITSVSIFANKDSFSYRNALKTAADYRKLTGKISPWIGPSKGMELVAGNFTGVIIVIFVMLLLINELVVRERESGQMNLLSATVKGRAPHGASKLAVCLASSYMVNAVMLFVSVITVNGIFGVGDLNRPIQSVYGFVGCTLEISVFQFLLFLWLIQSLAVFLITEVIYICVVLCKTPLSGYFFTVIALGIEAVLYFSIADNSYLALLKYLNIVTFANTGDFLSRYINISLFGTPVSYLKFALTVIPVMTVGMLILGIYAYAKRSNVMAGISKRRGTFVLKGRSTSTIGQELYKLLVCGGVGLILIGFIAYQIYDYKPMKEYFYDEDQVYYKRYMLELEGPVTEEKLEYIKEEERRYEAINQELMQLLSECPPEVAQQIAMQYQQKLAGRNALQLVKQHANELIESGGYFVYDTGFKLLTFDRSALEKENVLAIMAGLMLVLAVTYLFAGDDELCIDNITSVCVRGRGRLLLRKYLIGIVVLLAVMFIIYGTYLFNVLNTYGTRGNDFPVASLSHLRSSVFASMNFTIKGVIICLHILKYICMCAAMMLISWISKKIRSVSRTMVTSIVLFVGPLMIVYVL